MGNGGSGYFLRPEAGPVPYEKLQRRAKDVLNRIIETLHEAAASANIASAESTNRSRAAADDTIDINRASRLFFVSGEPGSGKSTLYLTLKAMLRDEVKYGAGCPKDILTLIGTLKGAVRWLDPIDLEIAGDKGDNLLAAVLVRLFEELGESDTALSKDCEEAIKELEDLATDIGIAWDGNLQDRAGALDPDTYSGEVMRTQRARLGVNKRLRKALNKLANSKCCGCHRGTLFVLPIDDFYLKPDASLQLLRLLRMISIPRLFFLVMGDIKTIEALFTEKSLADWTAVAGAKMFTTMPKRLEDALAGARELRARYLRKLLPPGQRAEIEAMDWYEAMKFKPWQLNGKVGDDQDLRSLLANIDLDTPWVVDKSDLSKRQAAPRGELLDFLTCRRLGYMLPEQKKRVGEEINEEKEAREAYTGLQILDATTREIMDLWIALQKLSGQEKKRGPNGSQQNSDSNTPQGISRGPDRGSSDPKAPPLLSLVLKFVTLAIEEQNFLNQQQQGELLGVLPTRYYYTPDTFLEMDRLHLGPESSHWRDENKVYLPTAEIWTRKHSPWKITVGGVSKASEMTFYKHESTELLEQQEIKQDPFAKLPPRPTAWIILLHDLASRWRPESVSENLIERLRKELQPNPSDNHRKKRLQTNSNNDQRKQDSPPKVGWVFWRKNSNWIHFPFPEIKTFQELDCILRVWNTALDWWREARKDKTQQQQVDQLIDVWELACCIVLGDSYDDFAARGDGDWFRERIKNLKQDRHKVTGFENWFKETDDLRKRIRGSRNLKPRKA
jgi:hypothetical protein